jgi:hypothetical protein
LEQTPWNTSTRSIRSSSNYSSKDISNRNRVMGMALNTEVEARKAITIAIMAIIGVAVIAGRGSEGFK